MRTFSVMLLSLMLIGHATNGHGSILLDVSLDDGSFDENAVWVGVIEEDISSSSNQKRWVRKSTQEFSVAVPNGDTNSTLVFLKKNCMPVVVSLTPDLLETGMQLKCSKGLSIRGSVTTDSGRSIAEGRVSLNLSQVLDFSLPDPSLSSWEIQEGGSFEIRGLRPGRYEVTVTSPEYMPAIEEIVLVEKDLRREMNVILAKAEYVTGRIVDHHGSPVRGELDAEVTPLESQTTAIEIEFDRDDNFRIGPFAEGVKVVLTAHDGQNRRSRPVEVQPPAEGVDLLLHRWVILTGKFRNPDTGDPVEEFQVTTSGEGRSGRTVDVFAPDGQLELEIDDLSWEVEVLATGFLWWTSGRYISLEGRETYDLGTVDLEPVRTVRGQVIDGTTRLPIEGAVVRRIAIQDGIVSSWNFNNVVGTTDTKGEFEITGLPTVGGLLTVSARKYQRSSVPVVDVESYMEVELEPANGTISGRVISLNGEPVYPASVSLGPSYGIRNAEDGSFIFDGFTGSFSMRASAASGRSEVVKVTVEHGEHVSGLEFVISEVGRVHGTVEGLFHDETARVSVAGLGASVESSGGYEMRGVPFGEHVVRCTTSSGREKSRTIQMDETLDARFDFVFEGNSSITGRVLLAGEPAPSLEVKATPINENHTGSQTTTIGDGTFVIEGLNDGFYDVRVTSRGVSRNVAVEGDVHVDIDLGSNEVSGQIKSSSGSVLGVHVYLTGFGSGEKAQQHTRVDASGFYRFSGLPSGSYEVTVDHDNYKETTRSVEFETSVYGFDILIHPTNQERATKEYFRRAEQLGL